MGFSVETYVKAINYNVGDYVTKDLWYKDAEGYVWLAIKSGTPNDFSDRDYFDIVG